MRTVAMGLAGGLALGLWAWPRDIPPVPRRPAAETRPVSSRGASEPLTFPSTPRWVRPPPVDAPGPGAPSPTEWEVTVRVFGADHLAAAAVRVGWVQEADLEDRATEEGLETDADGRVRLEALPPGPVLVWAAVEGDGGAGSEVHGAAVRVDPDELREDEEVELMLEPVARHLLVGRVVDDSGGALTWVDVEVRPLSAPTPLEAVVLERGGSDFTGHAGTFRLELPTRGPWRVEAWASGRREGEPLASAEVYLADNLGPVWLMVEHRPVVRCTLLDAHGRESLIESLHTSWFERGVGGGWGRIGMLGVRSRATEVRLAWPGGSGELTVHLIGAGLEAERTLRDPGESCQLPGIP